MLSRLLALVLMLSVAAPLARALAQEEALAPPILKSPQAGVRPVPNLVGAGIGGAAVGAGAAAVLGLATGLITYQVNLDDPSDMSETVGLAIGTITGLTLAVVTIPLASAFFVHRAGREARYPGRYGYALLGAGGGMLLGALAGGAVAVVSLGGDGGVAAPVIIGLGAGIVAAGGLGALGYRLSGERRARLAPFASIGAARGPVLGIAGRF